MAMLHCYPFSTFHFLHKFSASKQCCFVCAVTQKRMLHISGVFTATIDTQQQKVTVTGSVGVETLLRKLVKAGKHAEIWPENLEGKGKSSSKEKKENKSGTKEPKGLENKGTESAAKCGKESKSSSSKTGGGSPEKPPVFNQAPPEGGGGGGSGKKKKKRTQSGGNGLGAGAASRNAHEHSGFQFQNPGQVVGQVNLDPTRQQSFSYPEAHYPPSMVYYVASHNRFYPMGRFGGSYYVPPSPYISAGIDQDGACQFQSPPLVSFEIFSDENANGCSIM